MMLNSNEIAKHALKRATEIKEERKKMQKRIKSVVFLFAFFIVVLIAVISLLQSRSSTLHIGYDADKIPLSDFPTSD